MESPDFIEYVYSIDKAYRVRVAEHRHGPTKTSVHWYVRREKKDGSEWTEDINTRCDFSKGEDAAKYAKQLFKVEAIINAEVIEL